MFTALGSFSGVDNGGGGDWGGVRTCTGGGRGGENCVSAKDGLVDSIRVSPSFVADSLESPIGSPE